MFVDYAEIEIAAGDGGNGLVSFRREKYIPKGGPNGGDGGRGGDVYVRATSNQSTLLDFRYKRIYQADSGKSGGPNNRTGESGKPLFIELPVGTMVVDTKIRKVLADLTSDGQEILVANGGKGGRGNQRFKSSVNQAPRKAEEGFRGERIKAALELKSIADVGLVGLPNAGKSTLLSRLSAARPKIADYPFTTKVPNLGIVALPSYRSFVMADIPGLIEGAHAGKGMGIQFLRHIQRTRILLFLLDISSPDPDNDYQTLRGELEAFDATLLQKPSAVVYNKIDLIAERPVPVDNYGVENENIFFISAVSGENIDQLLDFLGKQITK